MELSPPCPQESDALLRLSRAAPLVPTLGLIPRAISSGYPTGSVVCLPAGWASGGPLKATHALIEAASPQLLISVGKSPAQCRPTWRSGMWWRPGIVVYWKDGIPGPFQPLARLSEAAWQAAEQALQREEAGLSPGTAVTTRGAQSVRPLQAESERSALRNGDNRHHQVRPQKKASHCYPCAPSATGQRAPRSLSTSRR